MTENDYIAEYVKEQYPRILGADFALWKFGKMLRECGKTLNKALKNIPQEEIEKVLEAMESEEQA